MLNPNPRPDWPESYCGESNAQVMHRQEKLFPERGRPSDAGAKGSAGAGPAIFQGDAEMTPLVAAKIPSRQERRAIMRCNSLFVGMMLVAVALPTGHAKAADEAKYPDWKGQWERFVARGLPGQPSFDQTKPWGPGQQAPLTAEYRKVLEDSMADQAKGGLGNYPTRPMPARRHAAHDDCVPAVGIHRHAGDHLYPDRQRRSLSPHLHRRARLADRRTRTDLSGLFDRPMDRRGRRRPLRRAGGRDARTVQRTSRLRRIRPAATLRQPVHLQGTLAPSTGPIRTSFTTRSP